MFKFHHSEKIQVFVDGSNLYSTARNLGLDIDFKKFKALLENSEGRLIRINYYTALLDNHEGTSIRPLIDWLDYNGFNIVSKRAKEMTTNAGGTFIKGNIDVELAIDVLEQVEFTDHIVLVSGDGDFAPLVKAAQRRGCVVTVVSSFKQRSSALADELRRAADYFVDLEDLRELIGRKNERPED